MRKAVRYFCALYLAAMCLCGCAKQEEPSAYLFFTSDIEGVFWARPEPRYGNEVTGGLSVLKAFLDKQTVPFVLLEGGNWFAQTPEGTLSQGEYFNTAAATLPYAGRLFTEKDLAYGWGSLSQIIKDSPAPFILSNVTVNGKLPSGARPWLLVQAGEYRVGVFGIVSRQATEGKRRLAGLEITDEITAAREAVQTLREKGADVVVLISALGSSDDESALTDALQEICAKMETDLDAIPADATAAMNYCHDVLIPDMAKAREAADQLETLTASDYWPFPVYSDLLFYV